MRAYTKNQVNAVEQRYENRHDDILAWYDQVETEDIPRLIYSIRKRDAEIDRLRNVISDVLDQWEQDVKDKRLPQ